MHLPGGDVQTTTGGLAEQPAAQIAVLGTSRKNAQTTIIDPKTVYLLDLIYKFLS